MADLPIFGKFTRRAFDSVQFSALIGQSHHAFEPMALFATGRFHKGARAYPSLTAVLLNEDSETFIYHIEMS